MKVSSPIRYDESIGKDGCDSVDLDIKSIFFVFLCFIDCNKSGRAEIICVACSI